MGTNLQYINYRPAQLYDQGPKWYVYYSFRNPATDKMQRFKVYEDINRIPDQKARRNYGSMLVDAVNEGLKEGYNPFKVPNEPKVKIWTLGQALLFYKQKLPDMELRPRSQMAYLSMVNLVIKAGNTTKALGDLDQKDLISIFQGIRKTRKWSNTTYNNNIRNFSTFLNWCVKNELIKENRLIGLKSIPETTVKNKAFTEDEYRRLFAYLEQNNQALHWFCKFVYYTGTRPIQETRYLTMGMVDFDQKQLAIPGNVSKNKKADRIPLADELIEFLRPYSNCPGNWFIFTKSGQPGPAQAPKNYFTNMFVPVRSDLGLDPSNSIYALKHTRTVHLAEAGIDPYQIMKLWRHSSLEMTMIYMRSLGCGIARDAVNVVR